MRFHYHQGFVDDWMDCRNSRIDEGAGRTYPVSISNDERFPGCL
jgi:hypothetical protein